jgi:hypothetical protein
MPTSKTKAIVRKRPKQIKDIDSATKYGVLSDYKSGKYTWDQLREKYNLKSKRQLENWVNQQIQSLNIIKETSALNPSTEHYYHNFTPSNLINEPFLDLLSPPENPELSEQEYTYAYLYVYTGNNLKAVSESGLDAGLTKHKSKNQLTPAYKHACRMRGMYLRKKTNVSAVISKLRSEKLKDFKVDKELIVEELVIQLEELKESGENRKLTLDTIKLLGQTCSAFTEVIEIGEVNPAKSLEKLVEMAQKNATVKELPQGSKTDEVWEVEQ